MRGLFGRELNLQYGGVDARITYEGNALLMFDRVDDQGAEPAFVRSWVLARPVGIGWVERADVVLRLPASQRDDPAARALVETLDITVPNAAFAGEGKQIALSAVSRSHDRDTRSTEGLPASAETCGPGYGGVGRPAPSQEGKGNK